MFLLKVICGHEWVPYRVTHTNMRHVAQRSNILADSTQTDDKIQAVTWYETIPLRNGGVVASVMYYGLHENRTMAQHLLAAFRNVARACPVDCNITLVCHLQEDTDTDALIHELEKVCKTERLDNKRNLFRANTVALMSNV